MPVKNAGTYLKPCLDSILAQTYTNWELIAVNDGSTDGSAEVVSKYANENSNIHVVDSEGKGVVAALRKGYGLSSGEWIHRMDSDDLMPAEKLQLLINRATLGTVVTGKVSYFCDEYDIGEGFLKYADWLNEIMESGDFWRDVYKECPIPSSAWLMHRSDFERIGGFESDLMPEDYDLSFRIMEYNLKVVRVPHIVHHWRDSATRTSRNEKHYFPTAYIPLKVHYFLKIAHDSSKCLVLLGAGIKGKKMAKELLEKEISFKWYTNNPNKVGHDIYGIKLEDEQQIDFDSSQLILAISSPEDQLVIRNRLNELQKINNQDYYWLF